MKDIVELTKKIKRAEIFKEYKKMDYSLMPIIYKRIRTKELLHSDIIESLMKQSQIINTDEVLFKYFLEMINLKINVDTKKIKIENEFPIENDKRIDTLLTWDNNAIIIENKLNNAIDQPNQLLDYYKSINNKGYKVLKVVYIPNIVTKHAPKNILDEEIKKLIIEIYPRNLVEWLNNVKEDGEITDVNFERELINYINILNYVEMENKRIEENFELSNLLSKDDSILTAYKIHERWNDIKWHTEWEFWNDFENLIKEKYNCEILDFQKYSKGNIGEAVHKNRNINYFYGLAFSIAKIKDDNEICFYIERGNEKLYYGLVIKGKDKDKKDKWIVNGDSLIKEIKTLLCDIDGVKSRLNWLGIKYFEPAINFKAFNEKSTLLLKNKEQREKQIKKHIEDIDKFLCIVTENLKEKFIKVNI